MPDRFWSKVRVADSECWIWTAALTSKGYGGWGWEGVDYLTHRLTYTVLIGPIPDGLQIDHLCRVRACCNPEHLEPVTPRVNILRGESFAARQAAMTHCKRGHEFTPDNTYRAGKNGRGCRTCKNNQQRLARALARLA